MVPEADLQRADLSSPVPDLRTMSAIWAQSLCRLVAAEVAMTCVFCRVFDSP